MFKKIFANFWLKIFSLVLAIILWVIVKSEMLMALRGRH